MDFGFYAPVPSIGVVKGDADGNTGDDPNAPVQVGSMSSNPVVSLVFGVTNTGTEVLTDIVVSDAAEGSGTVRDLSCTFPDGSTGLTWAGPFVPGATFTCQAILEGVTTAAHKDVVTVTGVGQVSGKTVTASDPYHAVATADAPPKPDGTIETGIIGEVGINMLALAGGLLVILMALVLLVVARRRRVERD